MFEQLLNNAQDTLAILGETVLEELRVLQDENESEIDTIRDILDDAEAVEWKLQLLINGLQDANKYNR